MRDERMRSTQVIISNLLLLNFVLGIECLAQSRSVSQEAGAKTYFVKRGGHKVPISLPQGDISFADEVVSFQKGMPGPPAGWDDPKQAVGRPDYAGEADEKKTGSKCVTLGTGGKLTLRFVDNALVDVDGTDLYVWEVGPKVEPTELEISTDGMNWINIGKIAGATAEVDIATYTKPGEVFHYVRLTDRGARTPRFPGADIDAVAAIGSAIQFSLNAAVLFDSNKSSLKPTAQKELSAVAVKLKQYPSARILVQGHTDDVGSDAYNKKLSQERAQSVRSYFVSEEGMNAGNISITGFGEARPIASNSSETGRQKNRRVEIVVIPR
jgi:OmpA-OmpF porin, OOP family